MRHPGTLRIRDVQEGKERRKWRRGTTDRADLEEAVDGPVEEGVPHVDDDVDLGRAERPREAAVGHPACLLSSLPTPAAPLCDNVRRALGLSPSLASEKIKNGKERGRWRWLPSHETDGNPHGQRGLSPLFAQQQQATTAHLLA